MVIPDYQTIMLPLLKFAGDSKEHSLREAIEHMTKVFSLSEEEKKELLPSGRQVVIDNRVGWARTYLSKAGLLDSSRRGYFKITDEGLRVLESNPKKIDVKYLERFPSFLEFVGIKKEKPREPEPSEDRTPRELLEVGYKQIHDELAAELLNQVKSVTPDFFERLVVELLVKMGYGGSLVDAGRAIGKTGDEGIDGVIKEDKLGLDNVYIQAKRWENNVGRPQLQAFVGALQGKKARKGVFITTSGFSNDARDYAERIDTKIALIDGETLVELMIELNLGVEVEETYSIKKLDLDYFIE